MPWLHAICWDCALNIYPTVDSRIKLNPVDTNSMDGCCSCGKSFENTGWAVNKEHTDACGVVPKSIEEEITELIDEAHNN